jgi:hypothetical protein
VVSSIFIYIPNNHSWHIYNTDTYIDINQLNRLPDDVLLIQLEDALKMKISPSSLLALREPKADVLCIYKEEKGSENASKSQEMVLYTP